MTREEAVVGEDVLWAHTAKSFMDTVMDFSLVTVEALKKKTIRTTGGTFIPYSHVTRLERVDAVDVPDVDGDPCRIVKASMALHRRNGMQLVTGFDLLLGDDALLVEGKGKGSLSRCLEFLWTHQKDTRLYGEAPVIRNPSTSDWDRVTESQVRRERIRASVEREELPAVSLG